MMSFPHANSILLKKHPPSWDTHRESKKAAQVRGFFHRKERALNIDISRFQRILFNKGTTRFNRITH